MKKITVFYIAAPVLAGAIALAAWPDIEVRISQQQVASEIAQRLPVTVNRHGVTAVVREADVGFDAVRGVTVNASVDLSGYGLSGSTDVDAASAIKFRGGDFHLADLVMDDVGFTLDGASAAKVAGARGVASTLWDKARSSAEDRQPGGAALLDTMKESAEERLVPAAKEAVETVLRNVPVYSLNHGTWKHAAAAIALKDVRFESGSAVAVLDVGKAAGTLAMLAASILMGALAGFGWVMGFLRS